MVAWSCVPFSKFIAMKKDLETAEDVTQLVDRFYKKVALNELLIPFFEGLEWEAHLPKMNKFWRFLLFDEPGYTANVTEKHLHLPLTKEAFDSWLTLFFQTLGEHFEGPKVLLAKERAKIIAIGLKSKMNLLEN